MNDFLKLIKIVLPQPNSIPKNIETFEKKIIDEDDSKIKLVCLKCKKLSADLERTFKDINSTNLCTVCDSVLAPFVIFNLERQIMSIANCSNYLSQIIKAKSEVKTKDTKLLDTNKSGRIYREHLTTLSPNDYSISLIINTDGAPLNKANSYSMWPVMATILELDDKCRDKFTNILFLGNS